MKTKTLKATDTKELQAVLEQNLTDGFKPSLGIIFASIRQDLTAIIQILKINNIDIFGATTNGEFIDEDFRQGTIAVLLMELPRNFYHLEFVELDGKDDGLRADRFARSACQHFANPALMVVVSNLSTDLETILKGFKNVLGSNANITGGAAGDDHTFTEQFVFTKDAISSRGLLMLAFDQEKIVLRGRAIHGWKAVGTEKTITKSEGNRVYTIEGIPTLDICLKYSGLTEDTPDLAVQLVKNFPLQLQRENGSPLMRPAYHIFWEDHSMLTSGRLPVGSKIRFSLPPDFENIEDVIDEVQALKENGMPEADAVIIFNCGGRLMSFGPLIGEEIKGIHEVWNAPMAGMFSNSEIGAQKIGEAEMHNLTTCVVAIKEK